MCWIFWTAAAQDESGGEVEKCRFEGAYETCTAEVRYCDLVKHRAQIGLVRYRREKVVAGRLRAGCKTLVDLREMRPRPPMAERGMDKM